MFGAWKMNPSKPIPSHSKYRILQRFENKFCVQVRSDDVWLNIVSFATETAARNYVEEWIKRDNFKPRVIAEY